MTTLFPKIEPFETGRLDVGDGHVLAYECSGNPDGKPVVFLHGGPGAATTSDHRRYFDPSRYRIVLFDQRGCGKSTPHASITANTTKHLVGDIEALRQRLGIDRWQVFGGSWGSTLALAYALAHRERVTELVLRGIFTFRKAEVAWLFERGTNCLFPDIWDEFLAPLSVEERRDVVGSFYERLTSEDDDVRLEAARAWAGFEFGLITLLPTPELRSAAMEDGYAEALARIECHYMVHGGFLDPDDELLEGAAALTGIPTTIVHGRYDVICPCESAWLLAQRMPWADLVIVPDAGHSAGEPGIVRALVDATNRYAASGQ
ncbi:MAG: prolyl aminopeptidase [Planctomycetes bacterium]|nr:prolyl aminopeptidase [Planctomycetota bacterium]